MKVVTGACRFCGQSRALNVPDSFTYDDYTEEATKKCDCAEAVASTRIEEMVTCATADIKKFFRERENMSTFKNLLLLSVKPVAQGDIEKISMTREGYSVAMKKGKDGIDVTIKHTTVENMQ